MNRSGPRRRLLGCVAALLVGALMLLMPTPARGDQLTIRVSPPRTHVGSSVLVTGHGFTATAEVELSMSAVDGREGPELARTQVEQTGAFHVRVAVPDVPPGDYVVKAVSAGRSAEFTVSVIEPRTSASGPARIVGTEGDDVLPGTPDDDVIVGRRGDDLILGLGGHDVMCGGPGDDDLRSEYMGVAIPDGMSCGAGNDLLVAGMAAAGSTSGSEPLGHHEPHVTAGYRVLYGPAQIHAGLIELHEELWNLVER